MFEGVQDQFYQFLAGATPPLPPPPQIRASLPLSFSLLHGSISSSPSPFSTIFENYPSAPHLQPLTHQHHQMMQQPLELQYPAQIKALGSSSVKEEGENTNGFLSKSLDLGHPWSQDEVLALFRVRSAMENSFPEFTWEHVSRKMEEIGFRRSPRKCKEKFEEESRYLHTITTNTTSTINADEVISCPTKNINYRLFSELEELYHHSCEDKNDVVLDKENPQGEEELQEKEDDDDNQGQYRIGQERLLDENDGSEATDHHHPITIDEMDEVEKETEKEKEKGKNGYHRGEMKNSKEKKFKIFKNLCEDIVSKMMSHQEELHNKILEDLIKRDEEKIAREEAWKKQEMERINKEMEARAKDQAMVGDRQAKIIEFLKKFTSNINNSSMNINKNDEFNPPMLCTHQNPSSSATHSTSLNCHIPTSSNDESLSQTSNSLTTHIDPIAPTSNLALKSKKIKPNSQKPRPNKRSYDDSDNCDDTGKRWPREEVIALINIRCNLGSTNNTRPDIDHNEISNKNPSLWERISKSMMDLGYNRSAKRCKEKWENINKYFRKTKDSKKKRTVDSRTCPYFHQLSHLYSHGRSSGSSHGGSGGGGATLNVSDQGEVNGVHVTASVCDF